MHATLPSTTAHTCAESHVTAYLHRMSSKDQTERARIRASTPKARAQSLHRQITSPPLVPSKLMEPPYVTHPTSPTWYVATPHTKPLLLPFLLLLLLLFLPPLAPPHTMSVADEAPCACRPRSRGEGEPLRPEALGGRGGACQSRIRPRAQRRSTTCSRRAASTWG